jgi:hypothetical protein
MFDDDVRIIWIDAVGEAGFIVPSIIIVNQTSTLLIVYTGT